MVVVNDLTSAA